MLSGVALLGNASGAFVAHWVHTLHFIFAGAVLFYAMVHVSDYTLTGGRRIWLWTVTSAFKRPVIGGLVLFCFAGVSLLVFRGVYWSYPELRVHRIPLESPVRVDGMANEPEWAEASSVSLITFGGENFSWGAQSVLANGTTRVTTKAMHNGEEAFFFIQWQDPTQSLLHLPLLKTEKGWEVQQRGFHRFHEQHYYEDKFAVLLDERCKLAAGGTAHLGPQPLKDKPSNWHGRGYHYVQPDVQSGKQSDMHLGSEGENKGPIVDMWHWKAVRTNHMMLADDNYFGPPDQARPGARRYTAGYGTDGKDSGAYVMNWQWYRPDIIVPKRLPVREDALSQQQLAEFQYRYQQRIQGLQPAVSQESEPWMVNWFSYVPYDQDDDHYPIGTVLPSVLYRSNQFEGDRADVRAHGIWKDGVWSLELSRRLETGSSTDIALQDGVCMWVAAFDQSQIGHTRHATPLRLRFP
ncbi:hypothetical protein GCM10007877_08410 [Marinibactrum halimedae]|uniref:Cytochrome c-552/DMSO reductase-like haem-binding domain-containing protein n=2 Tax=Marinibactrum halimedae TaxID=1444977 RepID=A0AA37T558_9GAMM|nr:hypothetical protein GCM10007877_08410 [Marinibactrum halimedae]